MLAISAGAWAYLLIPLFASAGGNHHAHHHHAEAGIGGRWFHWCVMLAAMMFPLLIAQVRIIAGRSLWKRRNRAIALYLGGYLLPWSIYGLIAIATLPLMPFKMTAPLALALAAAWQITPWKASALRACHRTGYLAPFGWRADADCVRAGWHSARACLLSCWALMLPCVVDTAGAWLMPAIALFTVIERITDRPRQLRFAAVLLAASLVSGLS